MLERNQQAHQTFVAPDLQFGFGKDHGHINKSYITYVSHGTPTAVS